MGLHDTAERRAPGVPDALVEEEDTLLVLSADREVREPAAPRLRVFHEGYGAVPAAPGTVVVRAGSPVRLLAVVHDLSRVPSWREEWVEQALAAALAEAKRRGVRTLAMPVLGRVHGRMPQERVVALLRTALARSKADRLERIWIVTLEHDLEAVRALLTSANFP